MPLDCHDMFLSLVFGYLMMWNGFLNMVLDCCDMLQDRFEMVQDLSDILPHCVHMPLLK